MTEQLPHEIADAARGIIAGLTPDYRSGVLFREAPYNAPLEELPFGSSAVDGTRRFHAFVGPFAGSRIEILTLNGTSIHLADQLSVRIRYHVPNSGGGLKLMADMMGTDNAQIIRELVNLIGFPNPNVNIAYINPIGSTIIPVEGPDGLAPDVRILEIGFEIRYWTGD